MPQTIAFVAFEKSFLYSIVDGVLPSFVNDVFIDVFFWPIEELSEIRLDPSRWTGTQKQSTKHGHDNNLEACKKYANEEFCVI